MTTASSAAPVATTTSKSKNGKGSQSFRSSLAGFFGSALEYYDMYIYASASALVFSQLFFPDAETTGLLLSLGTYGVAYLARPLGGFLAGHVGDVFGRRNVMLATLLVMGLATFAIGCLPSYNSIGIWAPIILVLLRLVQGLSVGGELAGATSLTMEHAPEGRRGFLTSWLIQGIWAGYIIATLAFLAIQTLPQETIMDWGWRIPFWGSALIVILGLYIRTQIQEPEVFEDSKAEARQAATPISVLFKHQKADVIRVIFASFLLVISTTVPVYGLTYGVNVVGMDASTIMWSTILAYAVALATQPAFGILSDKIGRKPVMIAGNLVGGAAAWYFFWSLHNADVTGIMIGMVVTISIGFAAVHANYAVFFAEMFDVKVRMSGMAIGLQLGIIVTGFSPMIIQALTQRYDGAWWPAALVTTIACLISSVAIATGRETHKVPLAQLGKKIVIDESGDSSAADQSPAAAEMVPSPTA